MTQLEDRLREALDHAMSVRGEELLGAAHRGVRRRRTRRAVGVSLAAVTAVATVFAGVTLAAGDRERTGPVAPGTPTPSIPAPVVPAPGYVASTTTAGDALYVALLPCVEAVHRAPISGSSRPPVCANDEGPTTLWRYRSGVWEELGPLPGGVYQVTFGPDGRTGVGTDWRPGQPDRVPLTRDGGRTWTELALPAGGWGQALLTSTHVIVATYGNGWYAAPIGSDDWRPADPPDAGDPAFVYVAYVMGDSLIAEVLGDQSEFDNHYWVSEDAGQSWDGPRRFPGVHSNLFGATSSGLVAQCVAAYHVPCGQYLSTDLTTWQKLDVPEDMPPLGGTWLTRWKDRLVDASDGHTVCRLGPDPGEGWGWYATAGGEMFASVYRAYAADGRRLDFNRQQQAATTTQTLMVSRDGCATWEPMLGQ